ncbi:MAG: BrnT family toxin [Bacteroidetes bacterium]|nr:BrnT family toxin [Bacteroidota bacterium]
MINLEEITGFDWNAGNSLKNFLKHRVSNTESEEIFNNKPLIIFEDKFHSENEDRYLALGKTNDERKLSVSFTLRLKKIRIISARDMSKKERVLYVEKEI